MPCSGYIRRKAADRSRKRYGGRVFGPFPRPSLSLGVMAPSTPRRTDQTAPRTRVDVQLALRVHPGAGERMKHLEAAAEIKRRGIHSVQTRRRHSVTPVTFLRKVAFLSLPFHFLLSSAPSPLE